jgi:hypothetical protein
MNNDILKTISKLPKKEMYHILVAIYLSNPEVAEALDERFCDIDKEIFDKMMSN